MENEFNNKTLVTGLEIERLLTEIAYSCRSKNAPALHGIASCIDNDFNDEQKHIIYKLLYEIQEGIRWEGIDWNKAFCS